MSIKHLQPGFVHIFSKNSKPATLKTQDNSPPLLICSTKCHRNSTTRIQFLHFRKFHKKLDQWTSECFFFVSLSTVHSIKTTCFHIFNASSLQTVKYNVNRHLTGGNESTVGSHSQMTSCTLIPLIYEALASEQLKLGHWKDAPGQAPIPQNLQVPARKTRNRAE